MPRGTMQATYNLLPSSNLGLLVAFLKKNLYRPAESSSRMTISSILY